MENHTKENTDIIRSNKINKNEFKIDFCGFC